MNEFYEFEGTTYEVSPGKLDAFMAKFPNATKAQKSFEIGSLDENFMPMQDGPLIPGEGILTEDQVNDQKRHAEIEEITRENLKETYSNITGVPKFALPFIANFFGGGAGLISDKIKAVEATYENIIGMSAEEQRQDGRNPMSVALDSFHDFTDAFDTKYYDEQGKSLQVDELIERKEYDKAARLGAEQAAESAPSMIASAYNPLLGGALMGVSAAGGTYYDDLENRPDATINDVIKNSILAGSSEFLTELAGGYLFRRIGKIGRELKGTGNAEKVAKEYTKSFANKFITRTFTAGIGEGVTEGVNSAIQDLSEDWVYDEAFDKKQFFSNIVNSVVPALMLGGFGGGMSTLNRQDRMDLYKFTADGKWKRKYMNIGSKIYETSNDLKNADTKATKAIFEGKLKDLQKQKQKHEQDLFDAMENLSDKELTDRAKRIDKINKNAGIVGNNKYSQTAQKEAEQETLELLQKNYDTLGLEYTAQDISVDKLISESLKASERLDPMLKKLKGINKEDLETQVIRTDKELEALPENIRKNVESGDGYFLAKDKDGKAKIYINAKIAGLTGATNVVGHELLHYMISRKFKTDNKSMKPFIDNLKSYLQENHADVYKRLQTRIDNFYTNPDGTIKDGALEEYLEIFSDLVETQKIDLKENESKGFRDSMKDVLLGFGLGGGKTGLGQGEVQLDTAQDFIKFIRAYNKNINRKGLLGKLMGAKILDVKLKSKTLKKGETETIEKKSMSAAEVKQAEERVTEIGLTYNFEGGKKLWDEKGADAAIKEITTDGLLDNLIASKYKVENVPVDFVKDVLAQLTSDIKGFNPEINNDLGGYLGPRITFRAGDVYKKIYEKKGPATVPTEAKTKEGEVKVQVKAEKDVAMEELETKDIGIAAQIQERQAEKEGKKEVEIQSKFRKAIGIETGSDLYNKVLDSARKALLRAYKVGTSARNIQRKLRDEANLYLFKDVKNFLGTKKYVSNLKKFREAIVDVMFTADLVQMEREIADDKRVFTKFVRKLTSKKEVEDAVNAKLLPESALNIIDKGTAVSLYKKKNVTEAGFLSFFDIPAFNPVTGKRSGKRGTRKDQLAKYISGALAYDATMEVAQEPEVIEKRQQIAELNGENINTDDIQTLGASIGRDPSVKFSLTSDQVVDNLQVRIEELINNANKDKNYLNKIITVERDKNGNPVKYTLNTSLERDKSMPGPKQHSRKNKDAVARIVYKYVINNEYGSIVNDKKLESQLLKDIIRDNNKGKTTNLGIAHENMIKKLFQNTVDLTKSVLQVVGGGKLGDIYISLPGIILGIETKLEKARAVSQSLTFLNNNLDINFTNKNNTTNENGDLFDDIIGKEIQKNYQKFLKDLPKELGEVKNFKLNQQQADWLKANGRSNYLAEIEVPVEYIASAYASGKYKNASQGFIVIGRNIYRMVTGNSAIDNITSNIVAQSGLDIKDLQLIKGKKVKLVAEFMSDIGRNKKINFRIAGRINVADYVASNIDITNSKINKKFIKAVGVTFNNQATRKLSKSAIFSRSTNNPTKGITVLDFDDTLATTKSLVKYTTPDGKTGTLNAEEYAKTYEDLLNKGYKFDFSEFNKVVKGKLAPLFQKALKLQNKFGSKNMFVLTARPPAAQQAIFDFLKANGLSIPLENITGLGNSTAEAKALWIAGKVGEGYNDFYFADDALQNVQAVKNMLDQFDVKSKVQQAKVKFSQSMDSDFNKILEDVTGIEAKKRFSEIKARKRGASKGKFRLFIPPSHEDFVGLLYNFMGKGRKGDQHRNFFEQALVKPLNRAYREIDTAKQAIANDYKSLNKQFPEVKKKLTKETLDGDFTFQDAIRVYLWNKHGYDIPGLTKTDQAKLVELVMNDADLIQYAETLNVISKQDTYVDPGPSWETGNIRIDLIDATGRVGRAQYFTEFNENAETIFSPENLNKIEAAYGKDFREALEDMLHAIKTGINRPKGANAKPNMFLNWLNASVSGVMFFNTRSSILQQMSIVNYINFADNNMYAAGKAFANQPQYWKDWAFIFNSDMLKQRRGGIGTDINGAELAEAVKKARPNNLFDQVAIITGKLLKLGFLPTQIGDNIAIATGGATFYRNRINKYIKDGMSKKEAEAAAFTDFQNLTQSTQQSSRPDMTSQQQRSWIGKFILNFQNITSQYNRIIKKAALDVMKGRISPPYTTKAQSNLGNLSKILYYGGIQNVLFYSLQTALFAVMFDDDQDEDQILKKRERVINGSIDSILRGSGIYGAVASTLKNMVIKFNQQREKGYNKDESAVLMEALNLSPIVGIRARGIVNAEKTLNYNMPVIKEMETFDLDNPMWSAVTNYVQVAGFPANRLYQKSINMRNALNTDYTNFQRALFFSGYTTWSLGLGDNEAIIEAKEKAKINKTNTKKRKKKSIEKIFKEKSL